MAHERKVPSNVSLTERQTQALTREAKRVGISFSDQLRRVVDDWIDRKPAGPLASKIYNSEPAR